MSRLFAVILVMLSFGALASEGTEVELGVVCFPFKTLQSELKKFGEEPMVIGKRSGMNSTYTVVYVNKDTGSYTIVEMDNEAGCVISLGDNVMYRFPKTSSSL